MAYMLATVAPINMGSPLRHWVFDTLVRDACVPVPEQYTRVSEMLADGYVVTAMSKHPRIEEWLIMTLVKQG